MTRAGRQSWTSVSPKVEDKIMLLPSVRNLGKEKKKKKRYFALKSTALVQSYPEYYKYVNLAVS